MVETISPKFNFSMFSLIRVDFPDAEGPTKQKIIFFSLDLPTPLVLLFFKF